MTTFRRFIVFQTFLLWQGGFLFYTAIVVPAGTQVLGSAAAQGAITARVTEALNLIAVVGLLAFAWELNSSRDSHVRRTRMRWWCWGVAVVCQCVLFFAHHLLTAFMDAERMSVTITPPFYPVHRLYLWASTLQWLACLVMLPLTLAAWKAEDIAS